MFCGLETALSIPEGVPWAMDNGKFAVWSAGKKWDKRRFHTQLEKAQTKNRPPEWVVCPDEVGDADKTFDLWWDWVKFLKKIEGFKVALAVQDGMTPESVRYNCFGQMPDVIFVGGTTKWKWQTVKSWCDAFPRVHVGRAGTERLLWMAHRAGAESSDGTGWFRAGPENEATRQLRRYLTRSNNGQGETDTKGLLK